MKNHVEQIKELSGKILYCINEGDHISSSLNIATLRKDGVLQIGKNYNGIEGPKNLEIGHKIVKEKGDMLNAYITDDGFMHVMSRDHRYIEKFSGTSRSIKQVSATRIFYNKNGVLPYKFVFSADNDFLVYDLNYKLLGCTKNKINFKDVDFAIPDGLRFFDSNFTKYILIYNHGMTLYKVINKGGSEYFPYWGGYKVKFLWAYYKGKFKKAYDNINVSMTGYLVVTKDGNLKHINYEKNVGVDWQADPAVKGEGPYSMAVQYDELVLKNGAGEIYFSTSYLTPVKEFKE